MKTRLTLGKGENIYKNTLCRNFFPRKYRGHFHKPGCAKLSQRFSLSLLRQYQCLDININYKDSTLFSRLKALKAMLHKTLQFLIRPSMLQLHRNRKPGHLNL